MDRRGFLTAEKSKVSHQVFPPSALGSLNITSGLDPFTGAWDVPSVVHLLKRTMFGAGKLDIDYFLKKGMDQTVNELLSLSSSQPDPPVKNYDNTGINSSDPEYSIAQGQTWVNINTNDGTANSRRIGSFKSWWIGLMVNQTRSIQEKMVLFWHNHFATETVDINRAIWAYQNNTVLRKFALGNFRHFVQAITLDTGMLRYLNGYVNSNTAPDENYARELQELFTIGKENNPNYTEDDVKQAAKVLTGWRINGSGNNNFSYFDPAKHDSGNKQFSSFYNNHVVTGRTGATGGNLELDDFLNMIFSKQAEVSTFIVKKIYRWFCYYAIDSATQTNVIEPLAALFRTNWDIKPVLEKLLKSEHFYDAQIRGCIIKNPLDFVIGASREFNVSFPPSSDYINAYNMWDFLRSQATILQMNPGDPPNVAGWAPYYQAPQFYEIWVNSDTLPKRNRFTDIMITSGYSRNGKKLLIDPVAFTNNLSNPADPLSLLNDSMDILLQVPVSDSSKQIIKKSILLSGQDQDYYWSNAWYAYLANPNDTMAYQTIFSRLRNLYKYIMDLSEFQLT